MERLKKFPFLRRTERRRAALGLSRSSILDKFDLSLIRLYRMPTVIRSVVRFYLQDNLTARKSYWPFSLNGQLGGNDTLG